MIKAQLKRLLKHSDCIQKILVNALYCYLKITYYTSRYEIIWPQGLSQEKLAKLDGTLLATWHNRLAFSVYIESINNICALASTHTDGKIIIDILKRIKYQVIEGSTNRNPIQAIRTIINKLRDGSNILITADGPRGPVYEINSNITKLARKLNKPLIPLSCSASRYYTLRSWDRMMIPRIFSKITIKIGEPIHLSNDDKTNKKLLKQQLMQLSLP